MNPTALLEYLNAEIRHWESVEPERVVMGRIAWLLDIRDYVQSEVMGAY